MRRLAAAILLLASGASTLHAQQTPFDMSPERPAPEVDAPAAETPPAAPEEPTPPPPAANADMRRFLLPDGNFLLTGETDSRSWALHLTPVQAASGARLNLGYRDAVVVAPESSRLQVLVNDSPVFDEPVRSPGGFADLAVDLPEGLLRAGRNEISMRTRQRHRTDCTIQSTYELWTEVDAARTYLSFSDAAARTLSGVEDLRALGPDTEGRARIRIVAPSIARGDIGPDIVRLAQAVALHVNLPNLDFSIGSGSGPEDGDATLTVLLGTAEELEDLLPAPIPGASAGPVAAFAPATADAAPTLVVSGRTRDDWMIAIDRMLAPVDRPVGGQREVLVTEPWRTPNAPMIYGERDLSFAELGVRSQQFAGRRFTTSFQFGIPADFYAYSYGVVSILLDAAYADTVLPGSQINIFVNGSIAASVPLNARGGAVLDKLPIKLTTRHFRPGLNEVALEAHLLTAQDEACLPGATADETTRFAIFDSSRFVVPEFGRIAHRPDLAAFAGTGYPYGLAQQPVAIVAERGDTTSLSAAATLLARMAISAGRSIPTAFISAADSARARDAIFIGPVNAIPAGVLGQVGIAEESRTAWAPAPGGTPPGTGSDRIEAEEWRRQMEGDGWLSGLRNWFSRTFDITVDMLRFAPAAEAAFVPSPPAVLVVAQGVNPAGNGVWTVATAPDRATLGDGMGALAASDNWNRLSGRLVTLDSDLETVAALPLAAYSFVETRPPSFSNYRLVAANWLSANILSYSLALVVACLLLGIVTSALLSRLGRRR